jgi:hypothetical protein
MMRRLEERWGGARSVILEDDLVNDTGSWLPELIYEDQTSA